MDYVSPVESVISGARGRLLAALLRLDAARTISDVARLAGVSRDRAATVVADLERLGLVERRRAGRAWLVTLVEESPVVEALRQIDDVRERAIVKLRDAATAIDPQPSWMALYGSWVHGTVRAGSDLDVAVIAPPGDDRTSSTPRSTSGPATPSASPGSLRRWSRRQPRRRRRSALGHHPPRASCCSTTRSCNLLLETTGRTLAVQPRSCLMPATETRRRSRRLELRTTPGERELIDRAASVTATDLTEFVVSHAVEAAQRVLADRDRFDLDDDALVVRGRQSTPGVHASCLGCAG